MQNDMQSSETVQRVNRFFKAVWRGISNIWLFKIFETEFGYSDLLSNYSRTYAWMANQLGHMTLGLVTALILMWLAVTFTGPEPVLTSASFLSVIVVVLLLAIAARFQIFQRAGLTIIVCAVLVVSVLFAKAEIPFLVDVTSVLKSVIAWVLIAAVAFLLGAVLKKLLKGVCGFLGDSEAVSSTDQPNLRELTGIHNLSETWLLSALAFAALVTFAAIFGIAALGSTEPSANRLFGTVLTLTLAGLLVLFLCQDGRFGLTGVQAIFIAAAFILYDDTQAKAILWKLLPADTAEYLFLAMPALTLIAFFPRSTRWIGHTLAMVGISVAATLLTWWTFQNAPSPGVMVGIGFATASLAIWFAKEFGSDMPRARDEIDRTRQERRDAELPPIKNCMERKYGKHGIMDTRTDAAFYFAGAYVAAGLPVDPALINVVCRDAETAWSSDIEIVGTLVFILLFLAIGRNWALRQEAVDLTGSYRANRMALFWGAPMLEGECKPVDTYALELFARGLNDSKKMPDGEKLEPGSSTCWLPESYRHLIITGASGVGRTPLGAALATEAALQDIPTNPWTRANPRREAAVGTDAGPTKFRRTARFIKMSTLRWTHDGDRKRSELLYTPTRDFYFMDKEQDGKAADRKIGPLASKPKGGLSIAAATLVVIDDCHGDRDDFVEVCKRLSLTAGGTATSGASGGGYDGQSTVWLVADDHKPTSTECTVEHIKAALSVYNGDEDKIGVINLRNSM